MKKGFTLIELLIVIGIIAILAGIVIIAVNPSKQFAEANDAQRQSDINAILNAVSQYAVDNRGTTPAFVDDGLERIVSTAADIGTFCADLVPEYISALPVDPTDSAATFTNCASAFDTGYEIGLSSTGSRITVRAPSTEANDPDGDGTIDPITITR